MTNTNQLTPRQIQKKKEKFWLFGYRYAPLVFGIGLFITVFSMDFQFFYYSFWLARDQYSLETIILESRVEKRKSGKKSYKVLTGTINGKVVQAEAFAIGMSHMSVEEIKSEISRNPTRKVFVNHNAIGKEVSSHFVAIVSVEHAKYITNVSIIVRFLACNCISIIGAVGMVYFYWFHVSRRLWALSGGRIGSPR